MKRPLQHLLALILSGAAVSSALSREVVEASLPRGDGQRGAAIRGLLDLAPQPNGKLLMVFPGWPGIPRIELKEGRPSWLYLQQHVEEMKPLLHQAGISLMTVDCPTDQWGVRGPAPTACDDDYRSSAQHAQDVQALIERTRQVAPIQQFYVMGHSYGAVSSHWLAIRLGKTLAGSIHSATQSVAGGGPYTRYAATVPIHTVCLCQEARHPRPDDRHWRQPLVGPLRQGQLSQLCRAQPTSWSGPGQVDQ
jgi:pimeloyl-ACP methyl ester carboxylesterase